MSKQSKPVPAAPVASIVRKETSADPKSPPRGRRPARVPIDAPATKRKASTPKQARKDREAAPKRPSALDAAAKVLAGLKGADAKEGISAPDLIERMTKAKLWSSPGGKTPAATLYAAMIREITAKGKTARFVRVSPGRFRGGRNGAAS